MNAILRQLHSDLSEIHTITFDEIDVDVVELQPDIGSLITRKPIKDLDGFLIGGASKSSKKFIDIIKNFYK